MAREKMSSTDILRLLQGGTSYGGGSDPRRLLAVLLGNPQVLASLKGRAAQEVSPYQAFDPDTTYDPSSDINDVFYQYTMRPDKKQVEAAQSYFGGVEQGGITDYNAMDFNEQFKADLVSKGWDPADAQVFVTEDLDKNRQAYMKAEAARQKRQMKAFYESRKKAGLTGVPGSKDVGQFLEKQTGLAGLSEVPTSLGEVAKTRSAGAVEKWRKAGVSEAKIPELVARFEKQFVSAAKKQKKTAAQFTTKDVLARLIGGL